MRLTGEFAVSDLRIFAADEQTKLVTVMNKILSLANANGKFVQTKSQPAQLDLFADESRWPKKPYCTDDLEAGIRIRSLKQALTKQYIQANPPHLRVWSIYDIDRPGGALAWEQNNLPPPNWATTNRLNAHAHLVYGLSVPVLLESEEARVAPMRYLAAVESAFRAALQADEGYSGLITKNPQHPIWRVLRGPVDFYDLGYLAEHVQLEKHLPKQGAKPQEVGLGRNCILFDFLRLWAYKAVREMRGQRNFVIWQARVYDRALNRNADFKHPMDAREVWHIAKSVSKWVWKIDPIAEAAFIKRQSVKGAKGGIASGISRAAASEDKRASARLMVAKGMTQQDIAAELNVSQQTISRWLA